MFIRSLTLCLFLMCPLSDAEPQQNREATQELPWTISSAEAQGMDSELLLDMFKTIEKERIDLHGILVVRNGHVVLESYVHPYDGDEIHNAKSVTKSIVSILAGIALDKKILKSLDQPVHDFLPEYFPRHGDPRKKKIALRHLMTMTSGMDLDENGPIMNRILPSDDWLRRAYARPMIDEPGETFCYCSFLPHTMSEILTEASGKSLLEFADEHLFSPLGIEQVQWLQDPKGHCFGGSELWLTPRALAKIGCLFLDKGKWQGKQRLSKEWVEASTRNQLKNSRKRQYGYWWWIYPDKGYFAAMGVGGQCIAVKPDANLVVVTTSAEERAKTKIIERFVLPAVKASGPLPPKPGLTSELKAITHSLQYPTPSRPETLPVICKRISGTRYIFERNALGYSDATFLFAGRDSFHFILGSGEDAFEREAGLDGLYRITHTDRQGSRPGESAFALKGRWVNDSTLRLDSHEMGSTVHYEIEFRFEGEEVRVSAAMRPYDRQFSFKGSASKKGAD